MSGEIETARALLRQFEQSGYRDFHVRVGAFSMFAARHDGGANPMRRGTAAPGADVAGVMVPAPHIATMLSALSVGSAVVPATIVARLELLGEPIEIEAGHAGSIDAVLAAPGQLVEFGAPLVRITPAAR